MDAEFVPTLTTGITEVWFDGGVFKFQWNFTIRDTAERDDVGLIGGVTISGASPGVLKGDTLTLTSDTHRLEITNDRGNTENLTVYLKGPGGAQTTTLSALSKEDWARVTAAAKVAPPSEGARRETRARKPKRRTTRRRR
jgi:hypothetical protein